MIRPRSTLTALGLGQYIGLGVSQREVEQHQGQERTRAIETVGTRRGAPCALQSREERAQCARVDRFRKVFLEAGLADQERVVLLRDLTVHLVKIERDVVVDFDDQEWPEDRRLGPAEDFGQEGG